MLIEFVRTVNAFRCEETLSDAQKVLVHDQPLDNDSAGALPGAKAIISEHGNA